MRIDQNNHDDDNSDDYCDDVVADKLIWSLGASPQLCQS